MSTIEEKIKWLKNPRPPIKQLFKHPEKIIAPSCFLLCADSTDIIDRKIRDIENNFGLRIHTFDCTRKIPKLEFNEGDIYLRDIHQASGDKKYFLDIFIRERNTTKEDFFCIVGAPSNYQGIPIYQIPHSNRFDLE